MATNVTQKDKTLNEIIAYCEKMMDMLSHDLDIIEDHNNELSDWVHSQIQGQVDAYEDIALKCHHMLGYSGVMPLEVPNQSEDAQ